MPGAAGWLAGASGLAAAGGEVCAVSAGAALVGVLGGEPHGKGVVTFEFGGEQFRGPEPVCAGVEPDRRGVTLLGRSWERGLARASGPIVHATVDGARGLMAFTTPDELVVFVIESRAVLLRVPVA